MKLKIPPVRCIECYRFYIRTLGRDQEQCLFCIRSDPTYRNMDAIIKENSFDLLVQELKDYQNRELLGVYENVNLYE